MMPEAGQHPALLNDDVTTPAGCTIDGLLELEAGSLRVAPIKAVMEPTRRAGPGRGLIHGTGDRESRDGAPGQRLRLGLATSRVAY